MTSLKTMILALVSPTKEQAAVMKDIGFSAFDSSGKLKSFATIAEDLKTKLAAYNEQARLMIMETLGGSDAVRAMGILAREGAAGVNQMNEAINRVSASDVAQNKLDNLSGKLQQVRAEFGIAGEKAMESLVPAMIAVASAVTDVLNAFSEMDAEQRAMVVSLGVGGIAAAGAAGAMFGLVKAGTSVIETMTGITEATNKLRAAKMASAAADATQGLAGAGAAAGVAGAGFASMAAFIGPAILVLSLVAAGAVAYSVNAAQTRAEIEKWDAAQSKLNQTLSESPLSKTVEDVKGMKQNAKTIDDLIQKYEELEKKAAAAKAEMNKGSNTASGVNAKATAEFADYERQMGEINKQLKDLGTNATTARADLSTLHSQIEGAIPAQREMVKEEIAGVVAKQQQIVQSEELASRYESLSAKTALTTEENSELASVVEQLRSQFPDLVAKTNEQGRAIIINSDALRENIRIEKESIEASRDAAEKKVLTEKAKAEAALKSAEIALAAHEAIMKAEEAYFNASSQYIDAVTGKSRELTPDEERQERILMKAANNSRNAAQGASSAINSLRQSLKGYEGDLNQITGDAFRKIGSASSGGGKGYTLPTDPKKDKSADEYDRKMRESLDNALGYEEQRYKRGEIIFGQYIENIRKIREEYSGWLASNDQERWDLDNLISQSEFKKSTEWIDNEEQRLVESGATAIQVAQMKVDAYSRMAARHNLLAEDQAATEKNLRAAVVEFNRLSYEQDLKNLQRALTAGQINEEQYSQQSMQLLSKHTEFFRVNAEERERIQQEAATKSLEWSARWIVEEEQRMRSAGASEIAILEMKYDAMERVHQKHIGNLQEQRDAADAAKEAELDLIDAMEDTLRQGRELERDEAIRREEESYKRAQKAIQDKIDALEKEADAERRLRDMQEARKRLSDLEEQRKRVSEDKRFELIREGANGELIRELVADIPRLEELNQQIADQKTRIEDMQREETRRKQREAYERELTDLEQAHERKMNALRVYWDRMTSEEQIAQDVRNSIVENGLKASLSKFSSYTAKMVAEAKKAQAEIAALGKMQMPSSGSSSSSPLSNIGKIGGAVLGPVGGVVGSMFDIVSRMVPKRHGGGPAEGGKGEEVLHLLLGDEFVLTSDQRDVLASTFRAQSGAIDTLARGFTSAVRAGDAPASGFGGGGSSFAFNTQVNVSAELDPRNMGSYIGREVGRQMDDKLAEFWSVFGR